MSDEESLPVPEWASDMLRSKWSTLSKDDQAALIADGDRLTRIRMAADLRHTDSGDSLGARPAGMFTLDGMEHLKWHAERFEEPWNGWATPVVTRGTATNLLDDLGAEGGFDSRYDFHPDGGLQIYREDGEEPDVVVPDDDGLYHLGVLGWVFTQCE